MFKYITVTVTEDNKTELLLLPKSNGGINSATFVSYILEDSTYIFFSGSLLNQDGEYLNTDLLVKDFSRLNEILLMITLGMSHSDIQLSLGDYVCQNLNG